MTAISDKPAMYWQPHPMIDFIEDGRYRAMSEEQIRMFLANGTPEQFIEDYWRQRQLRIRKAIDDPLMFGFEPPYWRDLRAFLARKDEVYAMGGNGSAKTEIGGKLVNEKLQESSVNVLCIARDETSSKLIQQRGVYKYLPAGFRMVNEKTGPKKRDMNKKISYTLSGGFSDNILTLPNKSTCLFKTVAQFEQSAGGKVAFEGMDFDFYWIDEPLPLELLRVIQRRAGKRNAKIFMGATMLFGFDAVCAEILDGAKMLKTLPFNWAWDLNTPADVRGGMSPAIGYPDPKILVPELNLAEVQVKGCPPGHMPYMMQPINPAQGVIFMWTHWNVFLPKSKDNPNVPGYFDKCVRKSKATVRTWLFGWAEKLVGCQFPSFNSNVHIVPQDKIEQMLKEKKLTTYMSCDPATARSYFMLWIGVDELGRKFIFDESPRLEEGEWVSDDGNKGDGPRLYGGRGVNFYKGYIRLREKEHGIEALRRFGDPRAFATEAAAAEGGRSLLELFADEGAAGEGLDPLPFEPAKVMRSLLAEAASGSLDKINDALSYDTDKPISIENEPKLYVSDRCRNLIKCILHWDPAQGEKSPFKDPIDCLRYLFGEELFYVDPDMPEVIGGRGWGAGR
jgi:hypothetical protein